MTERTRRTVDLLIAKTLGCSPQENHASMFHTEVYCDCKDTVHHISRKDSYNGATLRNIPYYLTRVDDAFELLKDINYHLSFNKESNTHYCRIINNQEESSGEADTAMQAICIAFLRSTGVPDDEINTAIELHTYKPMS